MLRLSPKHANSRSYAHALHGLVTNPTILGGSQERLDLHGLNFDIQSYELADYFSIPFRGFKAEVLTRLGSGALNSSVAGYLDLVEVLWRIPPTNECDFREMVLDLVVDQVAVNMDWTRFVAMIGGPNLPSYLRNKDQVTLSEKKAHWEILDQIITKK